MPEIDLRKVYIRHREEVPETVLCAYAHEGFRTLGVEIGCFSWVDDIKALEDLGPEVGVVGYIGDVHAGLQRLDKPIPPHVDYPEELTYALGRSMHRGLLEEVRASISPVFVKPVEHKAFSGFLWTGDRASRMRVVTQHDDCPVWISDPVDFVSEYRSFIFHGDIVGCRLYKGDWSKAPDRTVVETAALHCKHLGSAFCLDWGVTSDGRTLLVEKNEGYSFGHYGLDPVLFARMLSAR